MMTRHHDARGGGSPARCLAVWVGASAVAAGVLAALLPDLAAAPGLLQRSGRAGIPFDALVATGAAVLLAGCTAWAWLVTTAVVLEALTGRTRVRRGCPPALRGWVLLACGVVLTAGAAPATAAGGHDGPVAAAQRPGVEDRAVLAGLPMPDLVTGPPLRVGRPPLLAPHTPREVVVVPGDTLWELAARDLPRAASAAEVDAHWRLLWRVNRDELGPDPDVIRPGTSLRLPPREDD